MNKQCSYRWGAVLLALCGCAVAQSLGDVARQQRIANTKNEHHSARVITNDEIPASAEVATGEVDSAKSPEDKEDANLKPSKSDDPKATSARALQAKIKAQKRKIASLKAHLEDIQRQMDDWNRETRMGLAVRSVGCAPGSTFAEWCDTPKRLQADSQRTQAQIDAEQKALEQTQEEVRRMGYGSAFYDPE